MTYLPIAALCRALTLRAETKDLQPVSRNLELCLGCQLLCERLDGTAIEFDHAVALGADELVMMARRGVDVLIAAILAVEPAQVTKLVQCIHRPEDGGTADPRNAAQVLIERIRGEACLSSQNGIHDRDARLRDPVSRIAEQVQDFRAVRGITL
jgi:hypothetical protein